MGAFLLKIDDYDNSHELILTKCNVFVNHYFNNPKDILTLDLRELTFIYPDYALLILCSFKFLENNGIVISGKLRYRGTKCIEYLARMSFFVNLNIDLPPDVKNIKQDSFVEIQKYNEINEVDVCNSLLNVIRVNANIKDKVFTSLDYCFHEILDNVLLHSNVSEGWVVMQYFHNLNTIRLIVCDFGIGIKEALSNNYNYTTEESLKKCIENGITNGKGQGHGLYATSEFIKLNRGWLSIISGDCKLDLNNEATKVSKVSHWQGTCVYLRINTNIEVDYSLFAGRDYDYGELVIERFDELFS